MLMRSILLMFSLVAPTEGRFGEGPSNGNGPPLSDQDLLDFVSSDFSRRTMMFRRVVIGTHNGIPVLVTYPCGDLCPENTRRIVRYDVPLDQCDRLGGRLDLEYVPRGIATFQEVFCKPGALVPAAGENRPVAVPPACLTGFVVRLASAADFVCAPPASRVRTRQENADAERQRDATGADGSQSCRRGYVWREAFAGDTVCVSPAARNLARDENRLGPERRQIE